MADKNYYPQTQGDISETEALKHTRVIDVTIDGSGRVGPYYPGNARSIMVTATANCKFQMRGSAGGLGASTFRDIIVTAEAVAATDTKVGHLDTGAVPHEFYLLDTSTSANAVTIYINY